MLKARSRECSQLRPVSAIVFKFLETSFLGQSEISRRDPDTNSSQRPSDSGVIPRDQFPRDQSETHADRFLASRIQTPLEPVQYYQTGISSHRFTMTRRAHANDGEHFVGRAVRTQLKSREILDDRYTVVLISTSASGRKLV